jgi:hypothetical protein
MFKLFKELTFIVIAYLLLPLWTLERLIDPSPNIFPVIVCNVDVDIVLKWVTKMSIKNRMSDLNKYKYRKI